MIDDVLMKSWHRLSNVNCVPFRSLRTFSSALIFARMSSALFRMSWITSKRVRAPSASRTAVSRQLSTQARSSRMFLMSFS